MRLEHVNDKFLHRLRSLLDRHLTDDEFKAESIAAELGISKSTLNRRLKRMNQPSINEFVKLHRFKKARALLSAGYKVCDVSEQVGFSNPGYFSLCFKRHFKKPPSLFSRSSQEFINEETRDNLQIP